MSEKKNGKISIALTKTKKKSTGASKTTTLSDDFGATHDTTPTQPQSQERSSPLVIPLTQPTTGPLDKLKQEDAAAAQALMDSAAHHFSTTESSNGDTNFSANGSLSIENTQNTFTRQAKQEESDAQQLQRDLENRASDVAVDSSVYTQVPIAEFGAALLRGMGWTGNDNTNSKEDSMNMPRPHRLGLGATPKLPEISSSNRMKRPDQVQRAQRLQQQHDEYQAKRDQQIRLDKQKTLQVESIVYTQKKRAKMVQLLGVPGLNQVLVQYEGDTNHTSVKKGSVVLVSREELEERPYRQVKQETNESKIKVKREPEDGARNGSRKRIKQEEDESDKYRDDGRHGRNDHDRSRDRSSSKKESRKDSHGDKKRRRTEESSEQHHWLIPNIRVRVVTKKLSSQQYKQKGLVLDVTHGGAHGTLQMSDGQILDRVPERYLETALPKVGGNAIILTGRHRLEKGKLLERNSDSGQGVVQVFEDMNVVKLSLDDMAEWCGPLDDDLEL